MPFLVAPIVAAAGITGTAASLISGVAGTAILIGATSLLQKAIAPKPMAGEPLTGIETQVQIGGDVARQIVTGTVKARGQLVFQNTAGANNEKLQQVYVLSDWICDGIQSVFINGRGAALGISSDDGSRIVAVPNGYNGLIEIHFFRGNQTQASGDLIGFSNPVGRWDANSVLTGMCYAVVFYTYQKDADLYSGGLPEIAFELKGARLYDWRKDTTNGGSGAHRWADVATWEYSENPVVILYNYLRGFYLNGERILGMGVPFYDIIHETFTAAANASEEVVTTTGDPERRYRCATILTSDQDVPHSSTLEALLSTFAGYLYDYAGFYVCQAGVAQTSVKTLTDGDLVIGQPTTFAAKRSRADLVNRIHGQFLDPQNSYESQSYTAQISDAGVINDNEELGRQLDLMSVPSQMQAERIARIRLREVRAQATATITVGFNHIDLQAGDWITWNSARFGSRIYRITERNVDPLTKAVSLQLSEINASAYSWTAADEGVAPAAPIRIEPGGRISTVSGFGINAVGIQSANGTTEIPGLRFFWTPVTDQTVTGVLVEYRIVGSATATRVTDQSPGDGAHLVTNGIVNATNYEARATIVTEPPRLTTWTTWVQQMTTPTFAVGAIIAELSAQLQQDINSINAVGGVALTTGRGLIRDELKKLDDKIEEQASAAVTEASTAYEERERHKVEIQGLAFAAIETERSTRVTETGLIADDVVTIVGRLDDPDTGLEANAGAVESLSIAIDLTGSGVTATSQKITSLTNRLDDPDTGLEVSASGVDSLKTAVEMTGSGPTARSEKITALESTVNNPTTGVVNTASVVSDLKTAVGWDGAEASRINVLETTVGVPGVGGGHTATLTEVAQSLNGTHGSYGVTIAVDNTIAAGFRMTGWRTPDGTIGGQFGIYGDLLVDGTIFAAKLAAGTITADKITSAAAVITGTLQVGDLIITTGKIGYSQVSQLFQTAQGPVFNLPENVWSTIGSVTIQGITNAYGYFIARYQAKQNNSTNTTSAANMRILRSDGVVVISGLAGVGFNNTYGPSGLSGYVPDATQNWIFSLQIQPVRTNTNYALVSAFMEEFSFEVKKR